MVRDRNMNVFMMTDTLTDLGRDEQRREAESGSVVFIGAVNVSQLAPAMLRTSSGSEK